MRFYQEFSDYYDYIFPFKEFKFDFLKDNLEQDQKKILDIATGTGTYALALAKEEYDVIGIDLSDRMIKQAREKAKQEGILVDFRIENMRNIEAIDNKFDLIYCIGNSLVHLDNLQQIKDVLEQVYSLLQQEGSFVLQIVNYDRILSKNVKQLPTIKNNKAGVTLERNYRKERGKMKFATKLSTSQGTFENSVLLYPLQAKELKDMLESIGFNQIEMYGGFDYSDYKQEESFPLVVVAKK